MDVDHVIVPVSDYDHSKRFYAQALEPLGFSILLDWHDERRAYLGIPPAASSLWLVESSAAGTLELAITVPDAEAVDAFHDAAVAAGARSAHAPGPDPARSSRDYAARVFDPDRNSLAAVCLDAAARCRSAA